MTPTSSDVIVVGGGIVGCAAAYFLAKDGHQVTLFERDSVAGHASGYAFGGIIRPLGDTSHLPDGPLEEFSGGLHLSFGESLADEAGAGYDFRRKASVILALDDNDEAAFKSAYRAVGASLTRDVRWLGLGELSHIEARLSPRVRGGLYTGDAYELEPQKFSRALWMAAEKKGARLEKRSVDSLLHEGGRVTGVTAAGEKFGAGAVVVAAGPWSRQVLASAGVDLPVMPLKGQIIRMSAPEPPMAVTFWWGGDYAATRADGLVWAGTTEERVGFDEAPTEAARERIKSSVASVLPYMAEAEVVKHTACLRPVMPDGHPVLGRMPGMEGLVLATGAGRNGIALGPGMGRVAADLALGGKPQVEVTALDPGRFLPSSPLPPGEGFSSSPLPPGEG